MAGKRQVRKELNKGVNAKWRLVHEEGQAWNSCRQMEKRDNNPFHCFLISA